MTKILILGSSGMLGNTLLRYFSNLNGYYVYGTARKSEKIKRFSNKILEKIIYDVNFFDEKSLVALFKKVRPDITINCIGIIKQKSGNNDKLDSIYINSLLPHLLNKIIQNFGSKLIHLSTDCVFSGLKGNYHEKDIPDPIDFYGKSKLLGEVIDSNSITIRTSLIGHELKYSFSLLSWFLNQEDRVYGYNNAIFSGVPTVELAYIIDKYIIPNRELKGLFHISAEAINKFELLNLISEIYKKKIKIIKSNGLSINRSLDSQLFKKITGYQPSSWSELIKKMYKFG